ncbi:MAG: restriction endonuclease subunit S [Verrucomicrobiales bacterium]|nr:restriction endonuclease subunit S [Verrucomicrobiales bacterium]
MSVAINTFFNKFGELLETEPAVQQIRTLVLRLAASGKLTDQKSDDGTGNDLLQTIFSIRDNAASAGKVKPRPSERPITAGDTLTIPTNWARTTIAAVCDLQTGATPSRQNSSYFGGDIAWLVSGDINKGQITKCDGRITEEGLRNSNCKIIPKDSVLIALNGQGKTRATVAMLRIPAALNQSLVSITPFSTDHLLPEYVFWNLRGRYSAMRDVTGQKQRRGLNMKLVGQLSLPIPPLAEQKRIVAKVDALMAQCDQLEAQLRERDARQAGLALAALARFAEAPTPTNLEYLFHDCFTLTPADLRKTVLTLAVQAKLAPQNPHDGDARGMIDRAMEKRLQTIKAKGLRRKKLYESEELIREEDLPTSWCVERLANLVDPENTISYGVLVPGSNVPSGIPFVRVQDLSINNPATLPNKTIAADVERPYARTRLRGAEILLCVVGATIGRLGVAPASWAGANIARAVARIAPIAEVNRDYLLLVLRSPMIQSYFATTTRTLAQPTLNVGAIEQTPIPLPPLAEQRRIVAKVDQLMPLVDEWETQLAAIRATATRLLDAFTNHLSDL